MFNSFIAILLVSLISMIGVATLAIKGDKLSKITYIPVSLAAGTFLANAFLHIIPEAYASSLDDSIISVSILGGVVLFFILDKILHWQHCHEPTSSDHPHSLATNNLIADGLHNFIDGIIIASAFSISTELGIITTIAVILHEIPQEIGDFGVLIYSGMSPKKALGFNFLSALSAFAGAGIFWIVGETLADLSPVVIAVSAGGFIYIAISDLLPTIKHESNTRKSLIQLVIMLIGMMMIFGLGQSEALHVHVDDHTHEEHEYDESEEHLEDHQD